MWRGWRCWQHAAASQPRGAASSSLIGVLWILAVHRRQHSNRWRRWRTWLAHAVCSCHLPGLSMASSASPAAFLGMGDHAKTPDHNSLVFSSDSLISKISQLRLRLAGFHFLDSLVSRVGDHAKTPDHNSLVFSSDSLVSKISQLRLRLAGFHFFDNFQAFIFISPRIDEFSMEVAVSRFAVSRFAVSRHGSMSYQWKSPYLG